MFAPIPAVHSRLHADTEFNRKESTMKSFSRISRIALIAAVALAMAGCAETEKRGWFVDGYVPGVVYASNVGPARYGAALDTPTLTLWKKSAAQVCDQPVPWIKVTPDEFLAACNVSNPNERACTIRAGHVCRVVSIYSREEAQSITIGNESLVQHEAHHYADGLVHP